MAPAHAAGGYFHAESLEVGVCVSPAESLHVSSVLLAMRSGNQNLCHWEPCSSEPDSEKGLCQAICLRPSRLVHNWPPMAQPVQPLSAAVEAGGQSSVGPANWMLWEAAALRLVHAHGLQREPFQSVYGMMHVILQSRRPVRPRRRQCRQRRHQCDPASDVLLLLRLLPLCPE